MGFKTYKRQSLRNKLFIIYITGFIIPLFVVNILSLTRLQKAQRNEERINLENSINRSAILIKNEISDIMQSITSIYLNRELYTFFNTSYSSYNEYLKARTRFFHTDSIFNQLKTQKVKTVIYTHKPQTFTDPILEPIEKISGSDWFNNLYRTKSSGTLFYNPTSQTVSVIRALDYRQPIENRFKLILKIDIPIKLIYRHLMDLPENIGLILDENSFGPIFSRSTYKEGVLYNYNFSDFKIMNQWSITAWINPNNNYYLPSIIIMLISLLSGSLIIYLLSKSYYSRILELSCRLKKVRKGVFSTIEKKGDDQDEITDLTENYNMMVEHIDNLIIDVAKNQYQTLINQIHPHYIINLLESIRMKSVTKGERETAKVLKHLSKSLRDRLNWSDNLVTVEKELETINDYLVVQKYRYGSRLDFKIDIEDECRELEIPKLSIEPFVENSVKHGINPNCYDGLLKVSIRRTDNHLICKISDNGRGMSTHRLKSVQESLKHYDISSEHIGISNTYWRLKKLYNNLNLDIQSEENRGTVVTLTLPIRTDNNLMERGVYANSLSS